MLFRSDEGPGDRVCLLDFDLHLGDVLSFLDLPGSYSMTDVLANLGRLDKDLLDASVLRHPSGIRVLAQSGKIEEAEHVKGADISSVIEFLQRHYDRIVIDGARGFHEVALAALDASHHVLLVLTQDVPAVRNTKRCLDLFRRLGYEGDRVQLVLNRFQKGSKITPEVIADALGVLPAAELANDFPAVVGAINRGQLLIEAAQRSKLTKDIDDLVTLLGGGKQHVRSKSGFFGALLGRNGHGSAGTPDAG